ncbi:hypothetical protein MMC31_004581 [Peltigera leucophlebia]|nr:hypothetical protein [Peltigera leucophlebia]
MASNHGDQNNIEPREHQPDPSKRSTLGSVANRIGTSASGLISSSLLRPDPLSVCSSLASIGGDGSKARPTSASSSASTSSSSIVVEGLSGDGTWLSRSFPQDQDQATQTSHLEQWRHYSRQNMITSEFDDFVSDSKRPQSQIRATIEADQTVGQYGFHAGSTPGFVAIQMDQLQAGVLADESCQATKASPSQLVTESFINPIRDRSGPEDFTSDWKRLRVKHFGETRSAQYRQKPGHRTTTGSSTSALRSPKNFVHLSNMIESPSIFPEDGAEVVSLLSDPEFSPGGEFNDRLQSSSDDFLLEGESWMSGAMASISSQSRETTEPDSFFGHRKPKAAPSAVNLAGSPSEEQIVFTREYPRFPARYIEEVWGYFSGTQPEAVQKYRKLDETHYKGRTTALSRLVMVFNHLGPNPTTFGAQN